MRRGRLITGLGILTAALLVLLWNPWQSPEPGTALRTAATIAFWVLFASLLVVLFLDRERSESEAVEVEGPRFARYLSRNTAAGTFWLPIRLFLGMAWLNAGLGKLLSDEGGWLDGGANLAAYWERAVTIPEAPARPAIFYDWYRDFISVLLSGGHEGWFAYVIVFGEIAVGMALIAGALTGIAAFFGLFMNTSFLLAGSVSAGPVMVAMSVAVILGWRVAGYYGVDRYLLPLLGTPWQRRVVIARTEIAEPAVA